MYSLQLLLRLWFIKLVLLVLCNVQGLVHLPHFPCFKQPSQISYILNEIFTHYIIWSVHFQSNKEHSLLAIRKGNQAKPLCYFQFLEMPDSLGNSTRIKIMDNICTASTLFNWPRDLFTECEWVYDRTNHHKLVTLNDVFAKLINITNAHVSKEDIGIIPSSICKCTNSTNYECSSHKLGHSKNLTVN